MLPSLTAPCPDLAPLSDGATFGGLLLEAAVEAGTLCRVCQARHGALARAVGQ